MNQSITISNSYYGDVVVEKEVIEELRLTLALGRFWEEQGKHKEADEKFRELTAQVRMFRVMRGKGFSDANEADLLELIESEIDEHGVEWALTKPEFRS